VFESNQTGVTAIYVAPFPSGARRQLSAGGGISARWGPDDREIYYLAPDGQIMVVTLNGPEKEAAAPKPLLRPCPLTVPSASAGSHLFDVSRDGGRFLTVCTAAGSTPSEVVVAIDALNAIPAR